jgi:hypothetical protein
MYLLSMEEKHEDLERAMKGLKYWSKQKVNQKNNFFLLNYWVLKLNKKDEKISESFTAQYHHTMQKKKRFTSQPK